MLAEPFERDENADRPPRRIESFCKFAAQYFELFGVGTHEQILCVILKEFAPLVLVGHLANPARV